MSSSKKSKCRVTKQRPLNTHRSTFLFSILIFHSLMLVKRILWPLSIHTSLLASPPNDSCRDIDSMYSCATTANGSRREATDRIDGSYRLLFFLFEQQQQSRSLSTQSQSINACCGYGCATGQNASITLLLLLPLLLFSSLLSLPRSVCPSTFLRMHNSAKKKRVKERRRREARIRE